LPIDRLSGYLPINVLALTFFTGPTVGR